MAPEPAACPEKESLLEDLRLVNRELNQIHTREIAAVQGGDMAGFEALQPELEQARDWRRAVVDNLKRHLIEHGC